MKAETVREELVTHVAAFTSSAESVTKKTVMTNPSISSAAIRTAICDGTLLTTKGSWNIFRRLSRTRKTKRKNRTLTMRAKKINIADRFNKFVTAHPNQISHSVGQCSSGSAEFFTECPVSLFVSLDSRLLANID